MIEKRPSLTDMFCPRGVAVVGATPGTGSFATGVVLALIKAGFPAIYPVNPNHTEIFGLPCYNNLSAIPGIVDNVVVCIPAESVLALLDDCAAKGVKSVQLYTAGFSESGYADRAELERQMLHKARGGGFRIIGPNCVGISVPKTRFVTMQGMPMEPGPIAFISQSGGYAWDLPYFGGSRGLRFSKVISYGNGLDVEESELLDYLSRDRDTGIIAAYIEGVRNGKRFLSALKEATQKIVVICRGGTTEAGKRTVYGHTASLSSPNHVFEALGRQMKVIQVDDPDGLIDVLVALRFLHPIPQGTGVAVMGAGGPTVSFSDEIEKAGLKVPGLPPEIQTQLSRLLPPASSILTNPIDSPDLVSPAVISSAMSVLGQVPEIHMLLYHLGFHPISRWADGVQTRSVFLESTTSALIGARQAIGKPILLVLRPPPVLDGMEQFLAAQEAFVQAGFPVFHSISQAATALARVIAWNRK